jgi:hypothetical protein
MILQKYEYRFLAGGHSEVLHIEESCPSSEWPARFRLQLPATSNWEAQTFYGDNCAEVAEQVTDFLTSVSNRPV